MASRIEWYLVEIERIIGSLLSEEEAYTVLTETEDHLRSKASDLVSRGMTVSQAERAATGSFGSPMSVAFGVLEERRSFVRERVGAVLLLTSAALLLFALIMDVTTMGRGMPGFVAMLPFVIVGALLTRKVLAKPLIAMGVLAGLTLGGTMVANNVSAKSDAGFYQSRSSKKDAIVFNSDERDELAKDVVRITAGLDYYRKLKTAGGNAAKVAGQPPRNLWGALALLPKLGYSIQSTELGIAPSEPRMIGNMYGYHNYELYGSDPATGTLRYYGSFTDGRVSSPTVQEAMERWLEVGPNILSTTERRVSALDSSVRADQQDLAAPWRFSTPVFLIGLGIGVATGVGLVLVQWLAIYLAKGFRWARAAIPRLA